MYPENSHSYTEGSIISTFIFAPHFKINSVNTVPLSETGCKGGGIPENTKAYSSQPMVGRLGGGGRG